MFDPKDYIEVANELRQAASAGDVPAEAAFRVAIGRYDYAVLLCVRDHFEQSEPMPIDRSETTHRWVVGKLRDSADPNSVRLTTELNTMRGPQQGGLR